MKWRQPRQLLLVQSSLCTTKQHSSYKLHSFPNHFIKHAMTKVSPYRSNKNTRFSHKTGAKISEEVRTQHERLIYCFQQTNVQSSNLYKMLQYQSAQINSAQTYNKLKQINRKESNNTRNTWSINRRRELDKPNLSTEIWRPRLSNFN